jgi:hypothetical protein
VNLQNLTAFLFHYASISYADGFIRDLTRRGKDDFLWPLQPKSGFLPEAGCGGTELLKITWGRGERSRATGFKATFKAKPVS